MTENEMAVAALAAELDGMKAERNWYRTAWTEAFRERDELRGRLDSLKQSEDATSRALDVTLARNDATSRALDAALARNETLEQIKASQNACIAKYRRELAATNEDLRLAREERDELRNWYQAAMEQAEEFGVGG